METLGAFLDAVTAAHPEREAVAWAPSDRVTGRLTRGALRAASRSAAKKLVAAGASKGTRIGLLCPNRLAWLPIAFGALRIGAVLVPFSTLWKREEIAYGLTHGDVALLLTVPGFLKHDYVARLREVVPELRRERVRGFEGARVQGSKESAHGSLSNPVPSDPRTLECSDPSATPRRPPDIYSRQAPALRRVVVLDGEVPGMSRWDELPEMVDDGVLDALERTVSPTDLATIFFTSGTTAQAKAVVHAHAALVTSARRIAECLGVTPDDAWWGHMPLFWSGGFVLGALATLAGGGRVVLQEVVDPGSALALLEAERCTIMAGWHQAGPLLDHPDFARHRLHLKKGTYHALAPKLMGDDHRTIGVYGMSETATCVTAARFDDPEPVRTGSFGHPLAGMEVRIADPDSGTALPAGETGEILVKGPTLMEGYYRVPRESTLNAEGFFCTGDRGFIDEDGNLHFGGRMKDVIKTAGVNVAAIEVEETLARHPAVQSAHVVGVPDPVRGENIAALVVLRPAGGTAAHELRAFCREALASYKVPRHLFVVGEADVPRTGSGKVEKAALRRAAEALVAREKG